MSDMDSNHRKTRIAIPRPSLEVLIEWQISYRDNVNKRPLLITLEKMIFDLLEGSIPPNQITDSLGIKMMKARFQSEEVSKAALKFLDQHFNDLLNRKNK